MDSYDIDDYTDEELIKILELDDPTDMVLESRIVSLIKKYDEYDDGTPEKKLYGFFNDVYDRFFYNIDNYTDEELIEDILLLENPTSLQLETKIVDKIVDLIKKIPNPSTREYRKNLNFYNDIYDRFFDEMYVETSGDIFNEVTGEVERDSNIDETEYSETTGQIVVESESERPTRPDQITGDGTNIQVTKQLDLAKGLVNPLLNQTIRRIISIDSQYRPNRNETLSGEFTFNLSDPLRDVVSLKLYSVGIPYTWYTVNNNFGSNFIILQGNSPGINNDNYTYQIQVVPGNYIASRLIETVNTSLTAIKNSITDASFGNTKFIYDSASAKTTFTFEYEKIFTESAYYLEFPYWTSPIDTAVNNPASPGERYKSIPGFLGFNENRYYFNAIQSSRILPQTEPDPEHEFTVTSEDQTITIKHMQSDNATIINTYYLNMNLDTTNTYTRTELINHLTEKLSASSFLTGSSIQRIDIKDLNKANEGYAYFNLTLQFNREEIANTTLSKMHVEFPNTSSTSVWRDCFEFRDLSYVVGEIKGETEPIDQELEEIVVPEPEPDIPSYEIRCIHPDFSLSTNDYIGTLDSDTYTLNEIVSHMQSKLQEHPQDEVDNENSAFLLTNDAKLELQLKIEKKFTNENYSVLLQTDTSQTPPSQTSFLYNVLDLSQNMNSIAGVNSSYNSIFPRNATYSIDSSFVMNVYPSQDTTNTNSGNQNQPPYIVNISDFFPIELEVPTLIDVSINGFDSNNLITFNDYRYIAPFFNQLFERFQDSDGDYTLQGTTLEITERDTDNLDVILTFVTNKSIPVDQYEVQFIDPDLTNTDTKNFWVKELNLPNNNLVANSPSRGGGIPLTPSTSSLFLVTDEVYRATLSENPVLFEYIIIDDTNNSFKIVPHEEGVVDSTGDNDYLFSIPNAKYTRTELLDAINTELQSYTTPNNGLSSDSQIEIVTSASSSSSTQKAKISISIDRKYIPTDFKLICYDEDAFVKCYAGVSSVRNTTPDATLGWLLGFHKRTTYDLSDTTITDYTFTPSASATYNELVIVGDSVVTTDLYNKLFIVLDDYNQSRLNDGLVTNIPNEDINPLPSYATRNRIICNPITGVENHDLDQATSGGSRLTGSKATAASSIAQSKNYGNPARGVGPFAKDVFAVIPIKTNSLQSGQTYTEFGGTLQSQERIYFGPVNISRMTVRLLTDRGDVINLNGSDWNFSLIAEQLYQSNV